MRSGGIAALVAIAVTLQSAKAGVTTYDTVGVWDGFTSIASFGNPDTATYGQTFIAPSDNVLDSFDFYVNAPTDVHLQFVAQVYAWSGSLFGGGGGGAVGPALFTGASTGLDGNDTFQLVSTGTGGVTLTPGSQYVALLTVSNPADFDLTTGTSSWGRVFGHGGSDGGGGFVFYNNGNDPSLLNSTAWDNFFDFGDLAWTARFHSAVPEPVSLTIWSLSLAGIVWTAARRK